jgi:hypothetical protein
MNKTMKYLSLVAILLFVSNCDDSLLDLEPISAVGINGYFTNADEVETGVVSIYDALQNVPLREFALLEMRSDNTQTKSSEGIWAEFEELSVNATNGAVSEYWQYNYNVIFRANLVLQYLDVVPSAVKRAQFEGEARFTRALAYFNLVRAFGDVPLIDTVIGPEDSDYFGRNSTDEIYALIVADLTFAADNLPTKGNITFGRATAGAAEGLLAKVHLNLQNYSAAETLLQSLVDGTDYQLEGEYADVFYAEGNDEILFAIPYIDDNANESQDYSFEMTAGGVRSGLNYLTTDFIGAIDPADTERIAVLRNPSNQAEVGKFLTQSADVRLAGNDWIVLRLADIYLLYAEAIMEGAQSTQNLTAIRAYNAVRDRVGLPTLAVDGSASLTLDDLLYERRMELAFENHRFYDLIRTGKAIDILGNFASTYGFRFSSTDLLLPIPQEEINVSRGLLSQNPGYN